MELSLRCFVIRDSMESGDTVVGIATEQDSSAGFSIDAALLRISSWTLEQARRAAKIRDELGYFASPAVSLDHVDEYPGQPPTSKH